MEKHRFNSKEPEFNVIKAYISAGDCIIDIGANIGHYTKKFSDLVGNSGRVFAMEPVQATFALLSSNVQLFQFQNVTLLNCAVSKIVSTVGMKIPIAVTGLKNYQLASLDENEKELQVLTIPVDCLCIPNRVKLVKIDTEGHELEVLYGMKHLIARDHPILIIETQSPKVIVFLNEFGYKNEKLQNSPNILCR